MAAIGLGGALDGEHARAQRGGDLDRCLADLAIAAADQHGAARARHAGTAQPLVGGDEGHADGAGLQQRERRRLSRTDSTGRRR